MSEVENLTETLNGGFEGLYGEVVTADIYKLRELDFIPDIVIDLGANVGCFTRFARELFPNALIVSVEPDKENFAHLVKFTAPENIVFLNKAIGTGKVWRGLTHANGSGATYLSAGNGFPRELMDDDSMEPSSVELTMPDELIAQYVQKRQKFIIKIDIEGNEHTIFSHPASILALAKADYLCMEIHNYALQGSLLPNVIEKTEQALKLLEETHDCYMEHVNFYATKKKPTE